MKRIYEVLTGIYDNLELRKTVVPLFIGKTGLGKTQIIKQFAKDKGAHLELFLTSSKPPFEIDGIGVPNNERTQAVHIEFDNILKLKDGDILFFDEMPNGLLPTLNASLTLLESRITAAGRNLPNIMIVAAGNYEGMTPMTPQIKERFLWYDVKFDSKMWSDYMFSKYKLIKPIANKLISLIQSEDFTTKNYYTPRSIDKAVNMIISGVVTPYDQVVKPILETLIENKTGKTITLEDGKEIVPNEQMSWLQLIRLKNNIEILNTSDKEESKSNKNYEVLILDRDDNIIGEVESIEKLKILYYFTNEDITNIEKGIKTPPLHTPSLHSLFFKKK